MRSIIQFKIYKGDKLYVGESIDFPIVTQGATIDEVVKNLEEALVLHLEGEDLAEFGVSPHPSALVNFELDTAHA
jgi:predicted RNase H-like HicB family nuclease